MRGTIFLEETILQALLISASNASLRLLLSLSHRYSYRLCKNVPGNISEECFQETPLKFAEDDVQWLQHINGTRYQIEMTKFKAPGTGTEWARIPFPTCATGGGPIPGHGFTDGTKGPDGVYYCQGGTEYPEPLLNGQRVGLIGFGYCNNTKPTFSPSSNDVSSSAHHCTNVTGRWLNQKNGIYVDMEQTSASTFTASCEGNAGWKNVSGTNVPGGIDLHYGPAGDLATFETSGAADAPPCSLLNFESGNQWCREPSCPAVPAPAPAPAPKTGRHSCTADKYHAFSIVDRVVLPADLEAGNYLISWRWDCEQTHQYVLSCRPRTSSSSHCPLLVHSSPPRLLSLTRMVLKQ